MAINKKLIHFQTMANFEVQLSAGNILDTSIVFIKDAKKIWTHGEFYNCNDAGEISWNDIYDKPNVVTIDSGGATTDIYEIRRTPVQAFRFTPLRLEFENTLDTEESFSVRGYGDLVFNCTGSGNKFLADNGQYKTVLTEPQDISGKQDKMACVSIVPSAGNPVIIRSGTNTYYNITEPTNDVYVFLPDLMTQITCIQHIMLNVKFGGNPNIQFIPGTGYGGTVRAAESFSIEPDSWYEISIINAGNGWIVSNIKLDDTIINPNLPSGNPTAVSSEEDELNVVEE